MEKNGIAHFKNPVKKDCPSSLLMDGIVVAGGNNTKLIA